MVILVVNEEAAAGFGGLKWCCLFLYVLFSGLLMIDKNADGVWLLHSTPQFPFRRDQNNFWPRSGVTNAQTFICVTFPYSQFMDIGNVFLYVLIFSVFVAYWQWLSSTCPHTFRETPPVHPGFPLSTRYSRWLPSGAEGCCKLAEESPAPSVLQTATLEGEQQILQRRQNNVGQRRWDSECSSDVIKMKYNAAL